MHTITNTEFWKDWALPSYSSSLITTPERQTIDNKTIDSIIEKLIEFPMIHWIESFTDINKTYKTWLPCVV